MTVREIVLSTGICQGTVYRDLHDERLIGHKDGRRWEVSTNEVMRWADECYQSGKYLMFPPSRITGFLAEIQTY